MALRRPLSIPLLTIILFSLVILLWQFSGIRDSTISSHPIDHVPEPEKPVTTSSPAFSQHLVVCAVLDADVSWLTRELPEANVSIYVVNDPEAALTVPKNKGRESMAYLTYIIDNYDNLADIEIFLHSDQYAWHNNDLLDDDTVKMVRALSNEHVNRVGYLNLRCHHEPGCPDWLHIDKPEAELDDYLKLEERYYTSDVWREMHGDAPIPKAISQPSGNQFAVTKALIRGQPRSEYIRYRDWLLNTPLEDRISGRFFEYIWHYIFTGKAELCPPMNQCYCEGFGICFGGPEEFDIYFDLRKEMRSQKDKAESLSREGSSDTTAAIAARNRTQSLRKEMSMLLDAAFIRGEKPQYRAKEGNRPWSPGDEFRI